MQLSRQVILEELDKLNQHHFCSYDELSEYVWIHEMAKYQISDQLDEKSRRVKIVNSAFHALPTLNFLDQFYKKYKDMFDLQPRKHDSL